MRKIFWLSVTMLLFSLTVSAQQKKVAVLDPICRDASVNAFFKQIVRGSMENVVTTIKEYQAYDRAAFDKIMEEQNFQRSGAVSDSDIKRLGVMAGVDYVVVPEVSAFDGYLSVLAKVLDVETGRYDKAENEVIKMEPPIVKEVCGNMAHQLFNNAGMKPSPQTVVTNYGQRSELQLEDGKYVGEVLNGKPHGKGIMYFNSDNELTRVSYEGDWVNGIKDGYGIMLWKNGQRFVGNWRNGIIDGPGKLYWKNGDRFEGTWKNGKRNGQGIQYYNNGSRFEGNYENDIINGSGKFYWTDGSRYEGIWKDGYRNGSGTHYWANGDKDMGTFLNEKREGEWIRIKANGKKLKAKYKDGEIVKDWH